MADELRQLAADFRKGYQVTAKAVDIVERGAVNIKKQLRSEASKSEHFGGIAPTISYDLHVAGLFADIGPEKGGAGSLAHIAYFGGVNGGGGTVPDPQGALDAEIPKFEKALADAAEQVLS